MNKNSLVGGSVSKVHAPCFAQDRAYGVPLRSGSASNRSWGQNWVGGDYGSNSYSQSNGYNQYYTHQNGRGSHNNFRRNGDRGHNPGNVYKNCNKNRYSDGQHCGSNGWQGGGKAQYQDPSNGYYGEGRSSEFGGVGDGQLRSQTGGQNRIGGASVCNAASGNSVTNLDLPGPNGDGEELPSPKVILFQRERVELNWRPNAVKRCAAGLVNSGNTCYLNSTLQCLAHIPPVYNYFLYSHNRKACCCPRRDVKCCLMCCLCDHMRRGFSTLETFTPRNVQDRVKVIAKTFIPGAQEDAHEFLRLLIEAAQQGLLEKHGEPLDGYSKETTVLSQIFGGYLRSQIQCATCGFKSNTFDSFMDICLNIKHAVTLSQALDQFVASELLEKDNAYNCSNCKQKVTATKGLSIHVAPNVLSIQLKRYDSGYGSEQSKVTHHVKFYDRLNLTPYMSKSSLKSSQGPSHVSSQELTQGSQLQGAPKVMYQLSSVLVHSGASTTSGHYYCYVRVAGGAWWCMSDGDISMVKKDKVLNSQAYMLFYVRIDPTAEPSANTVISKTPCNDTTFHNGEMGKKCFTNGNSASGKQMVKIQAEAKPATSSAPTKSDLIQDRSSAGAKPLFNGAVKPAGEKLVINGVQDKTSGKQQFSASSSASSKLVKPVSTIVNGNGAVPAAGSRDKIVFSLKPKSQATSSNTATSIQPPPTSTLNVHAPVFTPTPSKLVPYNGVEFSDSDSVDTPETFGRETTEIVKGCTKSVERGVRRLNNNEIITRQRRNSLTDLQSVGAVVESKVALSGVRVRRLSEGCDKTLRKATLAQNTHITFVRSYSTSSQLHISMSESSLDLDKATENSGNTEGKLQLSNDTVELSGRTLENESFSGPLLLDKEADYAEVDDINPAQDVSACFSEVDEDSENKLSNCMVENNIGQEPDSERHQASSSHSGDGEVRDCVDDSEICFSEVDELESSDDMEELFEYMVKNNIGVESDNQSSSSHSDGEIRDTDFASKLDEEKEDHQVKKSDQRSLDKIKSVPKVKETKRLLFDASSEPTSVPKINTGVEGCSNWESDNILAQEATGGRDIVQGTPAFVQNDSRSSNGDQSSLLTYQPAQSQSYHPPRYEGQIHAMSNENGQCHQNSHEHNPCESGYNCQEGVFYPQRNGTPSRRGEEISRHGYKRCCSSSSDRSSSRGRLRHSSSHGRHVRRDSTPLSRYSGGKVARNRSHAKGDSVKPRQYRDESNRPRQYRNRSKERYSRDGSKYSRDESRYQKNMSRHSRDESKCQKNVSRHPRDGFKYHESKYSRDESKERSERYYRDGARRHKHEAKRSKYSRDESCDSRHYRDRSPRRRHHDYIKHKRRHRSRSHRRSADRRRWSSRCESHRRSASHHSVHRHRDRSKTYDSCERHRNRRHGSTHRSAGRRDKQHRHREGSRHRCEHSSKRGRSRSSSRGCRRRDRCKRERSVSRGDRCYSKRYRPSESVESS